MTEEFYIYFIPCFILFNCAFIPFYKSIRTCRTGFYVENNPAALRMVKCIVLIFCIFGAFGGDWFHYRDEIEILTYYTEISRQRHLEDLYVWIIQNITGKSYILYRTVIWMPSILFLSAGLKRLKMDTLPMWCIFMSFSVAVSYAVGRGALGFSLIVWGYSFLLAPGKIKIVSYIFGVVLLYLSTFCHKSMFLLAPLTLVSFVNFNLKRTILCIVLLPLIIAAFRDYVMSILLYDDKMVGREYFVDKDFSDYGIGYNLWKYSYYVIIYLSMAYAYYRIIIRREQVPLYVRRIFNFVMLIFFEYLVIYFAFTFTGLGNFDLSWRIFAMINIPLPIVISYFFSRRVSRIALVVFNFSLLMADYFIMYNAYTVYE